MGRRWAQALLTLFSLCLLILGSGLLRGQEPKLQLTIRPKKAPEPGRATAVSPDGKLVAVSLENGTVRVFNFAGNALTTVELPYENPDIAFSSDSQLLAIVGKDVSIRRVEDGSLKAEISDGVEKITFAPAFSPNGQTLAAWSGVLKVFQSRLSGEITTEASGQIRFWDLGSGRVTRSLKRVKYLIRGLRFSPDGKLLAAAGDEGWELWDAQTGDLRKKHTDRRGMIDPIFLAGTTQLALCSEAKIKIFDTTSGKEIRTLQDSAGISALTGNNEKLLISGGKDGKLKVWDVESGLPRHTLDAHDNAVYSAALSSDGKVLATLSKDGVLKIWSLE